MNFQEPGARPPSAAAFRVVTPPPYRGSSQPERTKAAHHRAGLRRGPSTRPPLRQGHQVLAEAARLQLLPGGAALRQLGPHFLPPLLHPGRVAQPLPAPVPPQGISTDRRQTPQRSSRNQLAFP